MASGTRGGRSAGRRRPATGCRRRRTRGSRGCGRSGECRRQMRPRTARSWSSRRSAADRETRRQAASVRGSGPVVRGCPCHLAGRSLLASCPPLTRRKPHFTRMAPIGFLRGSIGTGNPSNPRSSRKDLERMAGGLRQVGGRDEGLHLQLPASFPECHVPSWVCRSTSRARSQEFSALSRHMKPTLATAC